MKVLQFMKKPHHISITFNFLVSSNDEENGLPGFEEDLAFRLGYDEAEIPIRDEVLSGLRDEIAAVLPASVKLNRVGGELSLNGTKIKNF